ncbi:hypothetical protein [Nonomuraea typhae]|uniref:hypothetical protein n=1 Tax=Nonomuraea typhae TaxID=2603600 RepID=UPI0012FCFF6E|nr:hypothetical protein [Nonomuraea typhae]
MNQSAAGLAADVLHWDEEQKLVRLGLQLDAIGVDATLRDNNSLLLVWRSGPGLPVAVTVAGQGAYYSWQESEMRHPADDATGAAAALAKYIADA